MTRDTSRLQYLLRGLLLIWLVLAQASAFAHELSQHSATGADFCATCSASHVLQAASCSSAETLSCVKQLTLKAALPAAPLVKTPRPPAKARAPPFFS